MEGSFFRKMAGTFGTRVITAVINLAIAILLSRFLGPEGKGAQSLIITTVTFILVFSNLVGGATLVYLAPRFRQGALLIPSYVWALIVSMISFPVLHILHLVGPGNILHTCILSFVFSLISIHNSMLIGRERIGMSNLISLAQPVILVAALLFYFQIGGDHTVMAYIKSLYWSFGFTYLLSLACYFSVFGMPVLPGAAAMAGALKEMFRLGLMNQVAHITQMLSFRLSYYILDLYHGQAAVGIYSNGVSLAESIWMISKSISLVQYARVSNTDDREASRSLTLKLCRAGFLASLALIIPLLILPEAFYIAIFGQGFEGVKLVIWALAIGVLVYNYAILLGHYFSGTGRYRINALVSTIGLALSASFYFILIPDYGIAGAGIASSLSYILSTLLLVNLFSREQKDILRHMLPRWSDIASVYRELKSMLTGKGLN